MKLALLACAVAACIPVYKVNGTSETVLTPEEARIELAMPVRDAAQAVVEKLGARGFAVVDANRTESGYYVKLAGNRDFSGTQTLGSVFYVWIDDADRTGISQVKMVGKPTVNHQEACPGSPETGCTDLATLSPFAISGREEAQVIHGVMAELRLDGDGAEDGTPTAQAATTAQAQAPTELGRLTLHGCGRP